MSNIFGSLHPFFESGAINGRKQANAGFMTALLSHDPFDEYHFFVANPEALQAEWALRRSAVAALRRNAAHAFHRIQLVKKLQTTSYHIFHFSDPVGDYANMCEMRNLHSPTLFPITSVTHSINYQKFSESFLSHMWEGCSPRDAIGTNSQAALQAMHGWYDHLRLQYQLPASWAQPQLHVMPMGVNPINLPQPGAQTQKMRHAMRHRLHLKTDSILLLLFGRITLDDKMDPLPLLLALRRIRVAHPNLDVRLVISGYTQPNETLPDLLRAAAKIHDVSVQVIPNPSQEEKHALFAAADIFTTPSDNIQETFGLSLLEAAGAALPTIASDWNGYREIIKHMATGILIPTYAAAQSPALDRLAPALFENQHQFLRSQRTAVNVPALTEAIVTLASDVELRHRMGNTARTHMLEHFTWQKVVEQWLEFWQRLHKIPVPSDVETHLRKARHPQRLPFGKVFEHYATCEIQENVLLATTTVGNSIREGRMPWNAVGLMPDILHRETLRQVLVLARQAMSFEELTRRILQAQSSQSTSVEQPDDAKELAQAHIYWALKHDLLEEKEKQKGL